MYSGLLSNIPKNNFSKNIFTPLEDKDPYYSQVLLLLEANSGVTDLSLNNTPVTQNGITISNQLTNFYGANFYNAGTSYLTCVRALFPCLSDSTTNYTLELWVYPTSLAANSSVFATRQLTSQNAGGEFRILTTGALNHYYYAAATSLTSVETPLVINQWHHLAWCRNNQFISHYCNGIKLTNTAIINKSAEGSTFSIGGGVSKLSGYFNLVRVTNGIARYNSNFIPPLKYPKK